MRIFIIERNSPDSKEYLASKDASQTGWCPQPYNAMGFTEAFIAETIKRELEEVSPGSVYQLMQVEYTMFPVELKVTGKATTR